jgi:hypothetical protein
MNAFKTAPWLACIGVLFVAGLAGAAAPTIRIDASTPAEERPPLQVKAEGADSVSFVVRIDIDPNDRRLAVLRDLREVRLIVRNEDKVVLDTLLAERLPTADPTSGELSFTGGTVFARFSVDRRWLDRCDLVLTTGLVFAGPRYVIDLRAYLPDGLPPTRPSD